MLWIPKKRSLPASSAQSVLGLLNTTGITLGSWWFVASTCPLSYRVFLPFLSIDVEYIYGFVWWGVCKQSRWRHSVTEPSQDGVYVTMATLWQQQDGGYALLFYIFNTTVIDWTCFIFQSSFTSSIPLFSSSYHLLCLLYSFYFSYIFLLHI